MRGRIFSAALFLVSAIVGYAQSFYYNGQTDHMDYWQGPHAQQQFYDSFRLTYIPEEQAIDCQFQLKKQNQSVHEGRFRCLKPTMEAGDEYVVRLRNLGSESVRLKINFIHHANEKSGRYSVYNWESATPVELPADSEWHDLVFPWADLKAGKPQGPAHPVFPLKIVRIQTSGAPQEQPFHLQLQSFEVRNRVERTAVTSPAVEFPAEITAGQELTLPAMTVDFPEGLPLRDGLRIAIPEWADIELEYSVEDGKYVVPEQTLSIPRFLPDGRLQFNFLAGEVPLSNCQFAAQVQGRSAELSLVQVRRHNGIPTIFINGVPHDGMMRASYAPGKLHWQEFIDIDVELFSFGITPTDHIYGMEEPQGMMSDGSYDFSRLNLLMQELLALNPDAYVLVRLSFAAPQWWLEQHPEAVVLEDTAEGKIVQMEMGFGKQAASWGSPEWRAAACESIHALVAYAQKMPWADRLLGFNLSSGTTQEWMNWSINNGTWEDYSPANTLGFQEWLTQKYGSDAALQAAWGDPSVTLATAAIPRRSQRAASGPGDFMALPHDQAVVDYDWYNSDTAATAIAELAHAVKEASDGRLLAGAFYGYPMELSSWKAIRLNRSSHLAVSRLLNCEDLDFFCSPAGYARRQVGGLGISYYMVLLNSILAHGKLYYLENDLRTHRLGSAPQYTNYGAGKDAAEDVLQVDKEMAHALCAGVATWWFEVGFIPYDIPEMLERIKTWNAIGKTAIDCDRASNAQIALIVDERSLSYYRHENFMQAHALLSQLCELKLIGAPIEVWEAGDLARLPERIRMVLFTSSVAPSEEQRQALQALKRDGRVIVFSYAQGAIRDGECSAEAMSDFTGMKMTFSTQPPPEAQVPTALAASKWLSGVQAGAKVGEAQLLSRADTTTLPVVADDAAEVLAVRANGEPNIAVKECGGWYSVVAADGWVPAALLIGAAQQAGVHRYITTPDQVWSNNSMLGICVAAPGKRTIALSSPAKVVRALDGSVVAAQPVSSFDWEFGAGQTELFFIRRD